MLCYSDTQEKLHKLKKVLLPAKLKSKVTILCVDYTDVIDLIFAILAFCERSRRLSFVAEWTRWYINEHRKNHVHNNSYYSYSSGSKVLVC